MKAEIIVEKIEFDRFKVTIDGDNVHGEGEFQTSEDCGFFIAMILGDWADG